MTASDAGQDAKPSIVSMTISQRLVLNPMKKKYSFRVFQNIFRLYNELL